MVYFNKADVMRHRLVREIIEAYENYNNTDVLTLTKNGSSESKK
jgi:phosphate starvation-inducible protein PhoH